MQVRNSTAAPSGTRVSRAITVAMLALALLAGGGVANVAEAHAATTAQVRAAKAAKARRARALKAARKARLAKARARRAALRALRAKRAADAKRRRAALRRSKSRKAVSALRRYGRGWRTAEASWYGPGFYGRGMAGGGKLKKTSMIVAHKTLPFGTKIQFTYKGRTVIATVKDRGPYVRGREFDFGPGIARALKMYSVANVRYRILARS